MCRGSSISWLIASANGICIAPRLSPVMCRNARFAIFQRWRQTVAQNGRAIGHDLLGYSTTPNQSRRSRSFRIIHP